MGYWRRRTGLAVRRSPTPPRKLKSALHRTAIIDAPLI